MLNRITCPQAWVAKFVLTRMTTFVFLVRFLPNFRGFDQKKGNILGMECFFYYALELRGEAFQVHYLPLP
jgi:hypothetical protein